MATYEIIVTDVTCYGSLYCVAGWDRISNRMIRPEPPGANSKDEASRFWSTGYAGPGKTFSVGNVVRFEATDPPPNFLFPHATEDRIVDTGTPMQILEALTPAAMVQAVAPGTAASLPLTFDSALVRVNSKAYVPTGNRGRSLGAIEIPSSDIIFFEHQWQNEAPKLRARVTSAGLVYDLSVPAEAARAHWRAAGLAALKADVKSRQLRRVVEPSLSARETMHAAYPKDGWLDEVRFDCSLLGAPRQFAPGVSFGTRLVRACQRPKTLGNQRRSDDRARPLVRSELV